MNGILILEDEPGYQVLLGEILRHEGYQVTPARSGNEALEITKRQQFDLFLIDYRLPGITGLEFLKRIREDGNETPAIIMTAYADVPVVVESMRLSAVDFLVKPFHIDSVLPLVERYLRKEINPSGPSQRSF